MENQPKNLKELIERGYAFIAKLPEQNQVELLDIESFDAYTVPIISHDYSAKTPIMWNSLYKKLELNIRNIMIVSNPKEDARIVINALRSDPKYIGGGFGVGWKEQIGFLDRVQPSDLRAVNIVVKENEKLIGYNTDASGFVKSLEEKFTSLGKKLMGVI